jgi:serine/threonine protein kinase/Tol biopolymer transport system component
MSDLPSGTRLGPYEVLSKLGAGGMGEVYKARDTRLDRTVAVKVILTTAAATAEFRDRFDREARAISALDHPHICTLYDVGHENDVAYLVMQFIEGENLADRLARAGRPSSNPTVVATRVQSGAPAGPASGPEAAADATIAATVTTLSASRGPLPIDLALRYASQIAAALDAAHRRGIVHRDLKPGNVMLTKSGTKLLDFGLAKLATSPITGFDEGATRMSPFGAVQGGAITGQGTILGTLHYMSPEQIEGREADARSDIFSFGALLFEMLSGRRAFDPGATRGEPSSPASVIAAIIGADAPELGELADTRTRLPIVARRALDRLLQKCLAKHPDDRWQSAADLSDELRWINEERLRAAEPDAAATGAAGVAAATAPPSRTRERTWMTATGMAVVAAIAVAAWLWPQPAPVPPPMQFALGPPDGTSFNSFPGFISLSPDGQHIAFTTGEGGDQKLWIRSVGALEARPVAAAIGATQVAWSPDSQSIVFNLSGDNGLRRVDLAGGPARSLAEAASERSAWSREGVILFTPRTAPQPLMRVSAAGGPATPATELNAAAGEVSHAWPVFLADGKRFIFLARNEDRSKSALFLASLDSLERTHLVNVHSMADLVPGYMLYHRDGTVYAHPFDETSGRLSGDPVPIVEGVQINAVNGRAASATSRTGLLVYRTGESNDQSTLTWLDRSGKIVGAIGQPGPYYSGALSPDGRRYVVPVANSTAGRDLVMIDLLRNITSAFTSAAIETSPVWTNDGESVIFSSNRKGAFDLYIKNAGGATPERPLFESPDDKHASAFTPDGKDVVFHAGPNGARRIWALPLAGDTKPYRVFPDEAESHSVARFSPDGKWLAYQAGASANVFVQPFPPTGYREQISAAGGSNPVWTDDGRQIAFHGPQGAAIIAVMIADVTPTGDKLRVSAPRQLFTKVTRTGTFGFTMDGRAERFLLVVPPSQATGASGTPLTVIANWPSLVIKK